jgi:hypothetical protein
MGSGSGRWFLLPVALLVGCFACGVRGDTVQVNTIRDVFARLYGCWRPPPPWRAHPMDITVIVSFNRSGDILGRPRITYESKGATDNDRLQYRIAVMQALQRCTPMPFTRSMAGAVAGHPFAVQFRTRPVRRI